MIALVVPAHPGERLPTRVLPAIKRRCILIGDEVTPDHVCLFGVAEYLYAPAADAAAEERVDERVEGSYPFHVPSPGQPR